MATAGPVSRAPEAPFLFGRVGCLRTVIILAAVGIWEATAASGLLFRDVVPSLLTIGRALAAILADPGFYRNLGVTAYEVGMAVAIGGIAGLAVGIGLGASRFAAAAYEHYVYYLGPTPK